MGSLRSPRVSRASGFTAWSRKVRIGIGDEIGAQLFDTDDGRRLMDGWTGRGLELQTEFDGTHGFCEALECLDSDCNFFSQLLVVVSCLSKAVSIIVKTDWEALAWGP